MPPPMMTTSGLRVMPNRLRMQATLQPEMFDACGLRKHVSRSGLVATAAWIAVRLPPPYDGLVGSNGEVRPWSRARAQLEFFAVPVALVWILGVALADLAVGSSVSLIALLALAPFISVLQPSRRATLFVGLVAVLVGVVLGAVQQQYQSTQNFIRILGVALSALLSLWVTSLRARLDDALELARQRADHDPLTGLLNRRELLARGEVLNTIREGNRPNLAVLMIDVDRFKAINDTWGHLAGDAVLVELAARCQAALRAGDLLGRFGGDEFIAVLVGGDPLHTVEVGERLVRVIDSSPVLSDAGVVSVTASVGAAVIKAGEPLEAAIRRADGALYEAKSSGRDRLSVA
jgi:diguanylate cyclase (GGDEF)-like protein